MVLLTKLELSNYSTVIAQKQMYSIWIKRSWKKELTDKVTHKKYNMVIYQTPFFYFIYQKPFSLYVYA